MGYIYKIENIINGKLYIGQTNKSLEERFKKHLIRAKQHVNTHLYNAMNKYGYDNFQISLIEEVEQVLLNEREIYYIALFNTRDKNYGYNMTIGGEACRNLPAESEQQRAKNISIALTGKKQDPEVVRLHTVKITSKKRSDELKKKMSEAQKKRYENSPGTMKGKHMSEEAKQKLREANLGKKQSEETKQKRKEALAKLKWYNNGKKNIRAKSCPDGFVEGRINFKLSEKGKANSSHKGTKWYTNGKENKMAYECPEGFWPGKTFKNKKK